MAVDMFLKLDGIDGESKDHKHKGEIEVLSFSWGLAQQRSGGTGKVSVQDFSFVKEVDSASPKLMEACCTGGHIKDAQITLVSKETRVEYMKIKLSDCLISSFQTGGAGGGAPMDQVSFNFSNVEIQAADRKGNFSSPVSCNFVKGESDAILHQHD